MERLLESARFKRASHPVFVVENERIMRDSSTGLRTMKKEGEFLS
jgi:hypothetical protein